MRLADYGIADYGIEDYGIADYRIAGGTRVTLASGTRLGPYEILGPLGAGGGRRLGAPAPPADQGTQYAVTADGERFLGNTASDTTVPITLVLNWTAAPSRPRQ